MHMQYSIPVCFVTLTCVFCDCDSDSVCVCVVVVLCVKVVSAPEVWQKLHMKHAALVRGRTS